MMKMITNIQRYNLTDLNAYFFVNPNQDAVLFSSQATKWTQGDVNKQTLAIVRGLQSLQCIANDAILLRLAPWQHIEKFTIAVAAANLRMKIFISKAENLQQLAQELQDTKARALLFDSYGQLGDSTNIDGLYRIIPEIVSSKQNSEIIPANFRFLRYLIQTDMYQFNGTVRFQKNLIKYGLRTDYDLKYDCEQSPIQLEKERNLSRPLFVTDPSIAFAFRAGVLNCLTKGYLLVCVEPDKLLSLSANFNHQIDIIATEESNIHEDNRVFVPVGSPLFKDYPKRFQI